MAGRDIKITIIGDASKAQKAFADAGTSAGTFETKVEGLGSKFGTLAGTMAGVVTGGALAALPGLLMDGAKGAAEDEAAMLRLEQAVKNSGKSYEDYSKAVDDQIAKGQELAFTDGETADALSTLISLTGSTEEGMKRLASAQDLARGAGISLEQAALLLGKTSDENTAALGRLGIQVGENATAQDVLNAVDAKYKGQAGIFAESQAGQMAIATQQAGELAESFGSFLLPIVALLTSTLLLLADAIQTHVVPAVAGIIAAITPVAEFIGGFIADNIGPFVAALVGIGTAILVTVIPAMVAWVAGTLPVIAAHVTMAAAVIAAYLPIIAIVAAVGVAAALLYAAWESNLFGIRDITQQVWDFVRPYFESAVNAIQTVVATVFPIIAQIVTTYIGILKTEIELGVAAARWAFDNVFVPIQGVVMDVFNTIAGIVATVWGPAVTAIGVGVDGVKVAFDGLVYIQGVVSDIFSTISGLVASLWLGASGGVGMILAGVATIYGVFEGAYDRMFSAGAGLMQGLIDGVVSLYNTFKGWIDKITGLMKIDVPGMSPPYHAGYEQGYGFVEGLADGARDATGLFDRSIGEVTDRMDLGGAGSGNTGGTGTRGTTGTGNTGGGGGVRGGGPGQGNTGGRGVPRDYDGPGFYYEKPNNGQGDGVIGDPAYMEIPPSGHFDNPQNVGGGKSFGVFGERMATKAAEKIDQANDDYLTRLDRRDNEFLREMSRYVERIVKSNEAVPGATAKAVRAALASAI